MPKAILGLEMPESCLNCPCIAIDAWGKPKCRIIHSNNGLADAFSSGRRTDCPLKMVEGKEDERRCEYCNTEHNKFLTDDVFMATINSYGDKNRVITSRHGLQYKTIRYCPMCGRRLEVEP
ncbi:MAG: hypothetical protein ACM3TR_09995 [Caulobacteraceae bacterium]